jgi:hypothetical protein
VPWLPNGAWPDSLLREVTVVYKVCIDVPRESYLSAQVPIPCGSQGRRIVPFFRDMAKTARSNGTGWRVRSDGAKRRLVTLNAPGGANDMRRVPHLLWDQVLSTDLVARWIE